MDTSAQDMLIGSYFSTSNFERDFARFFAVIVEFITPSNFVPDKRLYKRQRMQTSKKETYPNGVIGWVLSIHCDGPLRVGFLNIFLLKGFDKCVPVSNKNS